jgi:hypothetical protein
MVIIFNYIKQCKERESFMCIVVYDSPLKKSSFENQLADNHHHSLV